MPGTPYELDPVTAAFNIGAMNRWLDFNDAWFGRNGAHPSDNLGGILATADYLPRRKEGIPLLLEKFRVNLARRVAPKQQQAILDACADQQRLEQMRVNEFMALFAA